MRDEWERWDWRSVVAVLLSLMALGLVRYAATGVAKHGAEQREAARRQEAMRHLGEGMDAASRQRLHAVLGDSALARSTADADSEDLFK
jgi:hypothetical protein